MVSLSRLSLNYSLLGGNFLFFLLRTPRYLAIIQSSSISNCYVYIVIMPIKRDICLFTVTVALL